jgi:hypothetical protein
MQDDKDRNTENYPRPSTADEQHRNQDEFTTQKPNENSTTSNVADDRIREGHPEVKIDEREARQS